MYLHPERPSFEDEEFIAIYLSSFHANSAEHLSCNNSPNGLITEENLSFSRKAELSKVSINVGTAVMGRD